MGKIKWFQRPDEPLDVVEQATDSRRAEAGRGTASSGRQEREDSASTERADRATKGHDQGNRRHG